MIAVILYLTKYIHVYKFTFQIIGTLCLNPNPFYLKASIHCVNLTKYTKQNYIFHPGLLYIKYNTVVETNTVIEYILFQGTIKETSQV